MKKKAMLLGLLASAALLGSAHAQSFTEGFEGDSASAWTIKNNSTRNSSGEAWGLATGITDADGTVVVNPYEGNSFASASWASIGSGSGTISNWLISPEITKIQNGDVFSFYTTTTPGSEFPDRLEFRLSSAGAGTNVGTTATSVGTFTTVLTSVNSSLTAGGYPEDWTLVSVTMSGLSAPIDGRVAFRYFVTNGGPNGANSNIIGVDNFSYASITAVPEPSAAMLSLAGLGMLVMLHRRRAARR